MEANDTTDPRQNLRQVLLAAKEADKAKLKFLRALSQSLRSNDPVISGKALEIYKKLSRQEFGINKLSNNKSGLKKSQGINEILKEWPMVSLGAGAGAGVLINSKLGMKSAPIPNLQIRSKSSITGPLKSGGAKKFSLPFGITIVVLLIIGYFGYKKWKQRKNPAVDEGPEPHEGPQLHEGNVNQDIMIAVANHIDDVVAPRLQAQIEMPIEEQMNELFFNYVNDN